MPLNQMTLSNLTSKIFVLELFRTVENQIEYSRHEQRPVIKCLVDEKCKLCEIYRRMRDVYREVCFGKKIFTNGLNCLKIVEIVFNIETGQACLQW